MTNWKLKSKKEEKKQKNSYVTLYNMYGKMDFI